MHAKDATSLTSAATGDRPKNISCGLISTPLRREGSATGMQSDAGLFMSFSDTWMSGCCWVVKNSLTSAWLLGCGFEIGATARSRF